MPTWLTIVLALGGSAVISTIIGLILTRAFNKMFAKRDAAELAKKEQENKDRDELEEYRLFKAQEKQLDEIKKYVDPIANNVNEIKDQVDLVARGTLCSLRNDILNCYYRCKAKGHRNDYDYKNIHELYDSYHALHGNSFIDDVMRRFDALLPKEDDEEDKD